jgi:hypothetical protein
VSDADPQRRYRQRQGQCAKKRQTRHAAGPG